MNLVGKGFRLSPEEVSTLGYDVSDLPPEIKLHCNARDMMQGGEHCFVIDLFGYTAEQARQKHAALYQWLLDRVKPERDQNNRESRRRNWWLFGEPVGKLRAAWVGMRRIILTPETSKHRVFSFYDLPFCPDHKLYAICSDDAYVLGALSSSAHASWALRAAGRLGVGNDPTWTNTTCFLPFPFPDATPDQQSRIRALAEELDAHRKRVQAESGVTLTQMYNVLEDLRAGRALDAKSRAIHDAALVGVLAALHDEIDREVLGAYGWRDLEGQLRSEAGREAVLARLVALNAVRAAQEAKGDVHWLRPEYQCAVQAMPAAEQGGLDLSGQAGLESPVHAASRASKIAWPADLPAQVAAVAAVLAQSATALSLDDIAAHFSGRGAWKRRLAQIVDTLVALGRARVAAPLGYVATAG